MFQRIGVVGDGATDLALPSTGRRELRSRTGEAIDDRRDHPVPKPSRCDDRSDQRSEAGTRATPSPKRIRSKPSGRIKKEDSTDDHNTLAIGGGAGSYDVDRDPSLTCPHCGISYDRFRTGLTFGEVKSLLWTNSNDPRDWRYKRRHTVLGLWHQIKMEMWIDHVSHCKDGDDEIRCEQEDHSFDVY